MNFDDDLTVFDVINDPLIGVLRQADRVDLVSFIAILADAMDGYLRPLDPDQDASKQLAREARLSDKIPRDDAYYTAVAPDEADDSSMIVQTRSVMTRSLRRFAYDDVIPPQAL